MASSAASMAALRMLNLSNASPRSLTHRHLLRSATAATTNQIINPNSINQEQQLLKPFYSPPDVVDPSFSMKNLNTEAANLHRNWQHALGFSAPKIEAVRCRGKIKRDDYDDAYDDYGGDYSDSSDSSDDDDYSEEPRCSPRKTTSPR